LSTILSEEAEDFEVIVATPEEKEVRTELPREKVEALLELLDSLGWDKRKLKRYINAALRLRRLERERGKSYLSLIREYEKLSKEEVKLQYSISQLKEKREKIEEDLKLYMEQHELTLELVGKIAALISAMRERGLKLDDLEKGVNVLENFNAMGYDARRVAEELSKYRNLLEELETVRGEVERMRAELGKLEEEKRALEEEIKETHGIMGGLEGLKGELERLGEERARVLEELERMKAEAERLRAEIAKLTGIRGSIEEVEVRLGEMRGKLERLIGEEAQLKREIGELMGVRGEAEEIRRKMEEARTELERLEKAVEEKKAYVDLLEGEMEAAYAMLRLFTDPQGADSEDLESLAQQLQTLAKVKRGEISVLRPLEPHLLEKARESIISLLMPYIRKELVPRKAFEKIENELKRLNEKRLALEEEVASLRRALELKRRIEVVSRPALKEQGEEIEASIEGVVAVAPDGEVESLKTLSQGRRVRVTCPYCRNSSVRRIPVEDELEELASKRWRLRFSCESCGRFFEVDADAVLRRLKR